jgi:hypothetical protein
MDLEKQTRILLAKTGLSANSVDQTTEVSLFDAVRKWTDTEGVDTFHIELDGNRLTPEQIQAIAHSEAYKDRLLAFNERLAWMPRPRQRVCLQDGLKLNLNGLARKGFVQPGAKIGMRGIRFTHSYWGEIATGTISADMSGKDEGWFRVQLGSLDQWIILIPRPRHFGGRKKWEMAAGSRSERFLIRGIGVRGE